MKKDEVFKIDLSPEDAGRAILRRVRPVAPGPKKRQKPDGKATPTPLKRPQTG